MLGTSSPNVAEWTAAIATAVGGIGAALGALFAWFAAKAARDTAQEVRRAYAAARRPDLRISSLGARDAEPPYKSGVVIVNYGDVEAVDIDIVAEFVDGMIGHGRAERAPTGSQDPLHWFFVDLDPAPSSPDLLGASEAFKRVTMTFSDRERAGRWERVFAAVVREGGGKDVRLASETLLFP